MVTHTPETSSSTETAPSAFSASIIPKGRLMVTIISSVVLAAMTVIVRVARTGIRELFAHPRIEAVRSAGPAFANPARLTWKGNAVGDW